MSSWVKPEFHYAIHSIEGEITSIGKGGTPEVAALMARDDAAESSGVAVEDISGTTEPCTRRLYDLISAEGGENRIWISAKYTDDGLADWGNDDD